ncbi:hypothetical protein ACFWPA_09275 [Rhodococcus sp. NPDC058505]|uniref:hypothetical protein n=1 Tax=unclassified Rhodococcus (in: high G+C Gram-positive bacteria) TaxID=192944 RepID=UPI00364BCE80
MPNWGWLIVMLIVVDVAVVVVWLLTRRKTALADPYSPAFVRGLDLETRDRIERLVADHKQVQAIALLRERTDLGLVDAKAAVDAVARGEWVPTAGPDSAPPTGGWSDLAPALRALKSEGKDGKAARMLCEHTGMSLRQAKDTVARL